MDWETLRQESSNLPPERRKEPKEGTDWGIAAIIVAGLIILFTIFIESLEGFPGILTVILAFIPLLVAYILMGIYKGAVIVALIVTTIAFVVNLIPKYRSKVGLILSIISLAICVTIFVLLLKNGIYIDVWAHVT